MADNEMQTPVEAPKPKRRWHIKKPSLSLLVALVASVLSLTSILMLILQNRKLGSRIEDLEWMSEVRQQDSYLEGIEPSVGTIQFIRRGYSVEITKVNYTPSGLALAGFIGNPTQVWISALTLQFAAYQPRSVQRKDWEAQGSLGWYFPESIGSAQAETIDSLPPGGRQPFQVIIPNVRQTSAGFHLTVAFSGERYSYGP